MNLPKQQESQLVYEMLLLWRCHELHLFRYFPKKLMKSLDVDERSSLMASWLIEQTGDSLSLKR